MRNNIATSLTIKFFVSVFASVDFLRKMTFKVILFPSDRSGWRFTFTYPENPFRHNCNEKKQQLRLIYLDLEFSGETAVFLSFECVHTYQFE